MKQSLTEYLMSYCMSVEMTTDDLLPEIYADWITTCDPELIVELAEKWHKEQMKESRQRLFLDLLAYFSDYTVPLTMTANEVQGELEKFFEEDK